MVVIYMAYESVVRNYMFTITNTIIGQFKNIFMEGLVQLCE